MEKNPLENPINNISKQKEILEENTEKEITDIERENKWKEIIENEKKAYLDRLDQSLTMLKWIQDLIRRDKLYEIDASGTQLSRLGQDMIRQGQEIDELYMTLCKWFPDEDPFKKKE